MQAGNRLVIYCAGVTALLAILTFAATGISPTRMRMAVGSRLSSAFLVRTSIGRIDTDLLNLGLLYIIFCGVIMAGKSTTTKHTLFWCVVAGLMGRLFLHWYDKSQLVWLALASPNLAINLPTHKTTGPWLQRIFICDYLWSGFFQPVRSPAI